MTDLDKYLFSKLTKQAELWQRIPHYRPGVLDAMIPVEARSTPRHTPNSFAAPRAVAEITPRYTAPSIGAQRHWEYITDLLLGRPGSLVQDRESYQALRAA